MSFQQKLKELRLKNKLSQKNLAEKIGVAQSSINYWEKGERIPSAKAVQKIADYFNIPVDYLLYDDSKPHHYPPIGTVKIGDGENAIAVDPIEFIEHFNNVAKEAHPSDLSDLLDSFFALNFKGQKRAAEQVKLLTKIPEYRKEPEE